MLNNLNYKLNFGPLNINPKAIKDRKKGNSVDKEGLYAQIGSLGNYSYVFNVYSLIYIYIEIYIVGCNRIINNPCLRKKVLIFSQVVLFIMNLFI